MQLQLSFYIRIYIVRGTNVKIRLNSTLQQTQTNKRKKFIKIFQTGNDVKKIKTKKKNFFFCLTVNFKYNIVFYIK